MHALSSPSVENPFFSYLRGINKPHHFHFKTLLSTRSALHRASAQDWILSVNGPDVQRPLFINRSSCRRPRVRMIPWTLNLALSSPHIITYSSLEISRADTTHSIDSSSKVSIYLS